MEANAKNFKTRYAEYQKTFEDFLNKNLQEQEQALPNYFLKQLQQHSFFHQNDMALQLNPMASSGYTERLHQFKKSMNYSLAEGGKRFRPVLVLAVCESLKSDFSKVLPFSMALEMVHTYSLIHDDLPCMDNDDERRGRPTNHKVFGESTALLAGDALLTDAFRLACKTPADPAAVLKSIELLSECAGTLGMIGGQFNDLESQKTKINLEELVQMQANKTGALIRAAIVGPATLCGSTKEQIDIFEKFAQILGLSFQVKDDILDMEKNDAGSFIKILGPEKTQELLAQLTQKSIAVLEKIPNTEFLVDLARYNSERLS